MRSPVSIFPRADETSDYQHLQVLEIYTAFQGEGNYTGEYSTFVRLSGCTVGCVYCDTKYSWKAGGGNAMLPQELEHHVAHSTSYRGSVVLTGGEPLEHPVALVRDAVELLIPNLVRLTVETSGTETYLWETGPYNKWPYVFRPHMLWSVAPKLSSAKTQKPPVGVEGVEFWLRKAKDRGQEIQIKLVVSDQNDVDEAQELFFGISPALKYDVNFYIQPATNTYLKEIDEVRHQILTLTNEVQKYMRRTWPAIPPNVLVRPQLHALIFGNQRLV